jgi:O-antigen/teichoic acid export membrane protein
LVAPTPAVDVGGRVIARNALFNLLGQGLPLGVALVAVPILLRELGAARFGILGLVWMFATIFGDLGFGRAGTRFAAEALGAGRVGHLRHIAGVTVAAQVILGLALGALLAALSGVLSGSVLNIEPALADEARLSFLVLSVSVPVLMVGGAFRGFLEAQQRFGVVNIVRFWTSTLTYLLPLVVLAAGGGVVAIVCALVVLRSLGVAAFWAAARSFWCVQQQVGDGSPPALREILTFGTWVTVSTVVSPVLVYADRFLLGSLVSVAAVGVYTAPYEVITRILLVPAALASTLFPAVSALAGMGVDEGLRRTSRRSVAVVVALVAPVAITFMLFAEPLLGVWLGAEATPEMVRALQLLAPGVMLNAMALIPFSVLQGVGRADLTGKFHLLELPIHGALAWWLIGRFGVAGAAAAWSLRAAIDAALLFGAAHQVTRRAA